MTMRVLINCAEIQYKAFTFPGGEEHIQITTLCNSNGSTPYDIRIEWRPPYTSAQLMQLHLLTDALRREYTNRSIHLLMPYLPYARQDRVGNFGEALSLQVFCHLINSLNFQSVTIWDCHSDVGLALLNRVIHIPQETFVQRIPNLTKDTTLVAPDAGALKKIYKVAALTGCHNILRGHKQRDTTTGKITGTGLSNPFPTTSKFLIVDDICDGGATFIELAQAIRQTYSGQIPIIDLYVTHGIFSNGLHILRKHINMIYTPNPWPYTNWCNIVTRIPT